MKAGKQYRRSVEAKGMIAIDENMNPTFCNWSGGVDYVPVVDVGFDAHAVIADGVQVGVLTCVESGKMGTSQVGSKTVEMIRLWQRQIFLKSCD